MIPVINNGCLHALMERKMFDKLMKDQRLSKNIHFIIRNADKEAVIVWGRKSSIKTPDNNRQLDN